MHVYSSAQSTNITENGHPFPYVIPSLGTVCPKSYTKFVGRALASQWNYLSLHSLVGCCSKFLTSTRPHYKLPSASQD